MAPSRGRSRAAVENPGVSEMLSQALGPGVQRAWMQASPGQSWPLQPRSTRLPLPPSGRRESPGSAVLAQSTPDHAESVPEARVSDVATSAAQTSDSQRPVVQASGVPMFDGLAPAGSAPYSYEQSTTGSYHGQPISQALLNSSATTNSTETFNGPPIQSSQEMFQLPSNAHISPEDNRNPPNGPLLQHPTGIAPSSGNQVPQHDDQGLRTRFSQSVQAYGHQVNQQLRSQQFQQNQQRWLYLQQQQRAHEQLRVFQQQRQEQQRQEQQVQRQEQQRRQQLQQQQWREMLPPASSRLQRSQYPTPRSYSTYTPPGAPPLNDSYLQWLPENQAHRPPRFEGTGQSFSSPSPQMWRPGALSQSAAFVTYRHVLSKIPHMPFPNQAAEHSQSTPVVPSQPYPAPPPPTLTVQGKELNLLQQCMFAPPDFIPHKERYPGPARALCQAHLGENFQGPTGPHWMAYVSSLPLSPVVLTQEIRILEGDFNVSADDARRLLQGTRPDSGTVITWEFNDIYCLGYRIRCAKTSNLDNFDEAGWVRSPPSWPPSIAITVNNYLVQPRRKYHWQMDIPANISNIVHEGVNKVQVSSLPNTKAKENECWAIAVEVVELKSLEEATKMVHERVEAWSAAQQQIQAHLAHSDPDLEILSETLTLSITDPLSSKLIADPVRSVSCSHLECFDLATFLDSRPGNPTNTTAWKCPVCDGDARPLLLQSIQWMKEVIERVQSEMPSARVIVVSRDGTWKPQEEELNGQSGDGDETHAEMPASEELDRGGVTYIEID